MTAAPVIVPRRRVPAALALAHRDPWGTGETAFRVMTAATFVAIVIVRRSGEIHRATVWSTAEVAAVARRISPEEFALEELMPGDLAGYVMRFVSLVDSSATATRRHTMHRSGLERMRIGPDTIKSHWEISAVRMTGDGVDAHAIEAIHLGSAGHFAIDGGTWVRLTPVTLSELHDQIARIFHP